MKIVDSKLPAVLKIILKYDPTSIYDIITENVLILGINENECNGFQTKKWSIYSKAMKENNIPVSFHIFKYFLLYNFML